MSLILNIDTAVQHASICLAKDGEQVDFAMNANQKDQAAWVQPAIQNLLNKQSLSLDDLDAIAVSAGPGSYTGLRVGMATAKGLCYTLAKPLIFVNTLQMMADGATNQSHDLLCPMIDARRMEVFTAVYDNDLNEVLAPFNCILSSDSFKEFLNKRILFFGNGSKKFNEIFSHPNASFQSIETTAAQMKRLSHKKYLLENFADLAYSEPFYGKEFYTPTS